jgi:phenylacetic acid degradation operon negative regulatory protein
MSVRDASRAPLNARHHPAAPTPEVVRSAGAGPTLSRRHSVGAASARSWLLTILGEFALPAGQPTWTSTFVNVLAGLGLEEKASRQALARTATDGLIRAERIGRRARWHLTGPGRRLLAEGAERIYSFAGQTPGWDGRWLVLSVAVPESHRELRHRLRTRMAWAGFGALAGNLWVSPSTDREAEAKQLLAELGLAATTLSFTGPFAGIGSQRNLVEQAWNLDDIAERYREFLAGFADLRPGPGQPTMLAQVRLVHEWRRFPFLDPQLPAELLPRQWIGARAATVFHGRHTAWHEAAQTQWRKLATDTT